jgi:hypothetical protein
MIKKWTPPDVCPACGAALNDTIPAGRYPDGTDAWTGWYDCDSILRNDGGGYSSYRCLQNQLADYRRALLDEICYSLALECGDTGEKNVNDLTDKAIVEARAARLAEVGP